MRRPPFKFMVYLGLMLMGIMILLTYRQRVIGAPSASIIVSGEAAVRTVQPVNSAALRDSLNTVLPRIVIAFADKNRQEILSYPVGMVGDVTAPNVTNLRVTVNAANRSATITWLTDEFAQTLLSYGRQSGTYDQSFIDAAYAKQHTALITDLALGPYYFVIRSTDRDSNQGTTNENNFTVTDAPTPTPTPPPGLQLFLPMVRR